MNKLKLYTTYDVTQKALNKVKADGHTTTMLDAAREYAPELGLIVGVNILADNRKDINTSPLRNLIGKLNNFAFRPVYRKVGKKFTIAGFASSGSAENPLALEDLTYEQLCYLNTVTPQHVTTILDAYDAKVIENSVLKEQIALMEREKAALQEFYTVSR